MPDISMCMTKTCPKREECYRFKANPSQYQSYSDFTELCEKNDYEYLWPMRDKDER